MNRALRLAAALLPVLGLAGLWGQSHLAFQQGTEWEVPIMGYDPRDYLRGQYVEFAYDWPGYGRVASGSAQALCLEGTAPAITRVVEAGEGIACAHPVRANPADAYGLNGTARGRLYVGQARAAALEEALRNQDQRGIVTIRQREDGSFTPLAIRFRPLTPQELAERGAPMPQRLGE